MDKKLLQESFTRAYKIIYRERAMRSHVFPEGHPKRAARLAEMDDLLLILKLYKDELKLTATEEAPGPEQAPLFEMPHRYD